MNDTPDNASEPPQPDDYAGEPEPAPPPPGRVETEGRRLRRTAGVFGVVLVVAAIWLWPSQWGASEFVSLLAIAATIAASSVLAYQLAQLLVDEPLSEVARVLGGELLSERSKTRFLARLQHECSDAQVRARNRDFSLAVIALDASDKAGFEAARNVVRRGIRSRDVMTDLGSGEIWVLAPGAGANAVEALTQRLRDGIAAELRSGDASPAASAIAIGWSTFDDGAFNAKQMVAVARQRAGLFDAQVAAELADGTGLDEAA